jgi:hypothetical protein
MLEVFLLAFTYLLAEVITTLCLPTFKDLVLSFAIPLELVLIV